MEETYQLTSALKHLPWGKQCPLLTDARFSGVSTGACIGHIGPEALCGGPIGKLIDGDVVSIEVDLGNVKGSIDLVGTEGEIRDANWGDQQLADRCTNPSLAPVDNLPDDTRLWSILQMLSGGTWGGCVYDYQSLNDFVTQKQVKPS